MKMAVVADHDAEVLLKVDNDDDDGINHLRQLFYVYTCTTYNDICGISVAIWNAFKPCVMLIIKWEAGGISR